MDNENQEQRQPRHPRNLQGLLRFALEATRSEDAPHSSNFEQMDPERKQFLEDAMKSMTIDVVEQLENAAKTLTNPKATESDQYNALESIMDYVDNINSANDFCKIGGLPILMPCLNSPYPNVQSKTCTLIAELAQNNPFCQNLLLEINAIPKLIELLTDPPTASSAINAISCIVRSYEPALNAFIAVGGIECILGCMQSDQEKLVIRSVFLMNSLCVDSSKIRDEFIKLNAVEIIIETLKVSQDYDVKLETTLSALNILTECNAAVVRCQEPHLNLNKILNEITQISVGRSECLEIVEYSQCILEKVFNSNNDNTDR